MANTLDILRERLRAAGTVGISDAFAYQVLSYAQQMVNAKYARVLDSTNITLDANTVVFDTRGKLGSATRLTSIVISSVTVIQLKTWDEIFGYDVDWYTKTDATAPHQVWAQLGEDLFAVYPGKASNVTATVYYAKLTTTLNDATDDFEIPEEDWDLAYDIAEVVMHLHMRNYKSVKYLLDQLTETFGIGLPGSLPITKAEKT
jgi:hypothetical protein